MKTIIKNPRITEKASNALAHNVYIFDIGQAAGKIEIKKEIMRIYKLEPVKINILPIPRKRQDVYLNGLHFVNSHNLFFYFNLAGGLANVKNINIMRERVGRLFSDSRIFDYRLHILISAF